MKNLLFFLLVISGFQLSAQRVYLSTKISNCDKYIQIVSRISEAQYIVHTTSDISLAKKNTGNWYLVKNQSQADLKLCIVNHRPDAIRVYFSKYRVRNFRDPFKK